MFIFEWIEHYINTPEIQRTIADEAPLTAMFSVPATYECFDCPKCGYQNRVNERKGGHIIDEQRKADTDEHL